MKEKDLITKWLNHDLTPEELEAFKQLDAYSSLSKISETAHQFKAPEYSQETAFNKLKEALQPVKKKPLSKLWPAVAALIVISLGLFFLLKPTNTANYNTQIAEQTTIKLPDNSQVLLNAVSAVNFDENEWDRNITLQGEAFFDVAKGSTFTVLTSQGTVTVVGTQFSVKERPDLFEVICYEGKVNVSWKDTNQKITAGNGIIYRNNNVKLISTKDPAPSWKNNISLFKSSPLKEVLAELERQYPVKIDTKNVDTSVLFSGSFKHQNIVKALESITIPLNLKYEIINKETIRISN